MPITARKPWKPLAAEPDFDLMLLDINMPVMDGLTLLKSFGSAKTPPTSPDRLKLILLVLNEVTIALRRRQFHSL